MQPITGGMTGGALRQALTANFNEVSNYLQVSGEKLVTLGDSITFQSTWQPTLATILNLTWSSAETTTGVGGRKPMGVGGATILPYNNSGSVGDNSIYIRADDVQYYSPSIIFLLGGQNDPLGEVGSYDLSQSAYTGPTLPTGDPGMPTFVQSFKGILQKLVTQNPLAKIYAGTRMYNGTTPLAYSEIQKYIARRDAIKAMCDMYSVTFVDTLTGTGFNPSTNSNYFSDGVHPNSTGGVRLGEFIASKII